MKKIIKITRRPLFIVAASALVGVLLIIIQTALSKKEIEKNISQGLVLGADLEKQYFEAESGALAVPLAEHSDSKASGGKYIASPSRDLGSVIFTLTVPASDTYVLWGRILALDSDHDSLYVSVDGTADDLWDMAEGLWAADWQWTRVTGRNANYGVPSVRNLNPRQFYLMTGTHTFRFRVSEPEAKLDRLLLTNDLNFVPSDSSPQTVSPPAQESTPPSAATSTLLTLVKYPDNPTVYLLKNGKKRGIPSYAVYLANFPKVPILIIPEGEQYPDGPIVKFNDGVLLKGSAPTVYLIENGKKRPFTSAYTFWEREYEFASVLKVSDSDLALHEEGEKI